MAYQKKPKSKLYSDSTKRSKGVIPCNQCNNNSKKKPDCQPCKGKGYIPKV